MSGAITLPQGPVAVFGPRASTNLSAIPDPRIIQGFRPDYDAWASRGYVVSPRPVQEASGAVVCLPRAKAQARSWIAQAAALGGPVIVDGAKTDGIDAIYRSLRDLPDTSDAFAKAHGKVFALAPGADLSDWLLPETIRAGPWRTAPGGFSADGPDPGSVALAGALPPLKGRIADLGAGWGYLSAQVLLASSGVTAVNLVEGDHASLEAARVNITDPRASFHWADAIHWTADPHDHVVTNPPFHTDRKADPGIGTAFIHAAARLLKPSGDLVAGG